MKNEITKMINKHSGYKNTHEYKKVFLWILIGFPFVFYFILSFLSLLILII